MDGIYGIWEWTEWTLWTGWTLRAVRLSRTWSKLVAPRSGGGTVGRGREFFDRMDRIYGIWEWRMDVVDKVDGPRGVTRSHLVKVGRT